jgi:hypothetical protein
MDNNASLCSGTVSQYSVLRKNPVGTHHFLEDTDTGENSLRPTKVTLMEVRKLHWMHHCHHPMQRRPSLVRDVRRNPPWWECEATGS